jgi:hypothetical protein
MAPDGARGYMMPDLSNEKETVEKILARKNALGEELLILTHHYQRTEIVDLGDFRGDSFGLSQKAAAHGTARFIVFCGVHFMAESAEILSQPHQTVQIPALEAGCSMADMADLGSVERAWEELTALAGEESVMPIVYMNSDAALKAFCGMEPGGNTGWKRPGSRQTGQGDPLGRALLRAYPLSRRAHGKNEASFSRRKNCCPSGMHARGRWPG